MSTLLALEKEWIGIYVTHDLSFLERILAPDFVATLSDGAVRGKREHIAAYPADFEAFASVVVRRDEGARLHPGPGRGHRALHDAAPSPRREGAERAVSLHRRLGAARRCLAVRGHPGDPGPVAIALEATRRPSSRPHPPLPGPSRRGGSPVSRGRSRPRRLARPARQGVRPGGLRPSRRTPARGSRRPLPRGRGGCRLHRLQGERRGRRRGGRGRRPAPSRLEDRPRPPRDRRLGGPRSGRARGGASARLHDERLAVRSRDRRDPRPLGRPRRPRGSRPPCGGRVDLRRRSVARAAGRAARGALRPARRSRHRRAVREDAPSRAAQGAHLGRDGEAPPEGRAPFAGAGPAPRVEHARGDRSRAHPPRRDAPGSRVASRRRRVDAHPAGGRRGGVAPPRSA